MQLPEYRLASRGAYHTVFAVQVGDYTFRTPALASRTDGPGRVRVERVTVAPRGERAARVLSARLRRAGAPLVEVVLDYSLGGFEERLARRLGRLVAEECPEGSYCLPPILAPGSAPEAYRAVLEGYWESGGCGVTLPGWDERIAEELLGDARGCFVVVDAGRRGWRSLGRVLALTRGLGRPVYLVNIYRGGPVPRPAYELLFPLLGVDVLGYTRPSLRQVAAARRRAGRLEPVGLDEEKLVYRRGGRSFEEAAPRLLERLLEEVERAGLEVLDDLCPGCGGIVEQLAGEGIVRVEGGSAAGQGVGEEDATPHLRLAGISSS